MRRLLLVCFCVLISRSALADTIVVDPVTLTSGTLNIHQGGGDGTFAGDMFSATVFVSETYGGLLDFPLKAGLVHDLGVHMVDTQVGGPITYNGLTYVGGSMMCWTQPGWLCGSLQLVFTSSALLSAIAPTATVVAPFTLTGGFWLDDVPGHELHGDLIGSGLVTVELFQGFSDPTFGDFWRLGSATYTFVDPNVAAVPEPGTLLLIGAGVLAWRRRH